MPTPYRQQVAAPRSIKGLLLYLLPLPALVGVVRTLWSGAPIAALLGAASLALFMAAAYIVRRGLYYEAVQRQRQWARVTRVPWKAAGAALAGIATALCVMFLTAHNLLTALALGIGAAIGVLLTYGLDPQHSGADVTSRYGVTADEVADALDEAAERIGAIETAARNIRNPDLKSRLGKITAGSREILKIVERDPRDLRRARKFLKVYLNGARSVVEGYARSHAVQQNTTLETNFKNVLETIEQTIVKQKAKLAENDTSELDVQIEVLETQLKREGVV